MTGTDVYNRAIWGNYVSKFIKHLYTYSSSLSTLSRRRWVEFRRALKPRPEPHEVELFIKYITLISELSRKALLIAYDKDLVHRDEIKVSEGEIKQHIARCNADLDYMGDIVVRFMHSCINICVNANELTQFIWYTRKIPRKYLNEWFPDILRDENMALVKNLLGLREYFRPPLPDEDLVDDFTIYSYDHAIRCKIHVDETHSIVLDATYYRGHISDLWYPVEKKTYETLGGVICRLNELIWGLFHGEWRWYGERHKFEWLGEVPDLFMEWAEEVDRWLKEQSWEEPEEIIRARPTSWEGWGGKFWYPNWVIGIRLDDYEGIYILDDIMPALAKGKYELVIENTFGRVYERW